jgi:hypothetical protein
LPAHRQQRASLPRRSHQRRAFNLNTDSPRPDSRALDAAGVGALERRIPFAPTSARVAALQRPVSSARFIDFSGYLCRPPLSSIFRS